MTIMTLSVTAYTDVAMTMTPLIRLLDEIIYDKATKSSDSWQLSTQDLTSKEIHELNKLRPINDYKDLQSIIDNRCDDHFEYGRDTRGYDD